MVSTALQPQRPSTGPAGTVLPASHNTLIDRVSQTSTHTSANASAASAVCLPATTNQEGQPTIQPVAVMPATMRPNVESGDVHLSTANTPAHTLPEGAPCTAAAEAPAVSSTAKFGLARVYMPYLLFLSSTAVVIGVVA